MWMHKTSNGDRRMYALILIRSLSVADPGIPRKGSQPKPEDAYLLYGQIILKTAWKWRKLSWRRGGLVASKICQCWSPPKCTVLLIIFLMWRHNLNNFLWRHTLRIITRPTEGSASEICLCRSATGSSGNSNDWWVGLWKHQKKFLP